MPYESPYLLARVPGSAHACVGVDIILYAPVVSIGVFSDSAPVRLNLSAASTQVDPHTLGTLRKSGDLDEECEERL